MNIFRCGIIIFLSALPLMLQAKVDVIIENVSNDIVTEEMILREGLYGKLFDNKLMVVRRLFPDEKRRASVNRKGTRLYVENVAGDEDVQSEILIVDDCILRHSIGTAIAEISKNPRYVEPIEGESMVAKHEAKFIFMWDKCPGKRVAARNGVHKQENGAPVPAEDFS